MKLKWWEYIILAGSLFVLVLFIVNGVHLARYGKSHQSRPIAK